MQDSKFVTQKKMYILKNFSIFFTAVIKLFVTAGYTCTGTIIHNFKTTCVHVCTCSSIRIDTTNVHQISKLSTKNVHTCTCILMIKLKKCMNYRTFPKQTLRRVE